MSHFLEWFLTSFSCGLRSFFPLFLSLFFLLFLGDDDAEVVNGKWRNFFTFLFWVFFPF